MRLTFLGTGTSFGVPQIGCDCEVCRSEDARDKRNRTAALVEADGATLLVDTPPELRLQLIGAHVTRLDAVLYTHEHADHINGIDDLRMFSVRQRAPIPIYGPPETLERVRASFNYIFDDGVVAFRGTSKPRLELRPLEPGVEVDVAGVRVLPLAFEHGNVRVYGYRFDGRLAYVTDVKAVPPEARAPLRGLDVLVLNALWWRSHPTHMSIREAIETARDLGARRTYLTHLTHETGHDALAADLARELPLVVAPAYDGQTVEVA